MIKIDIKISPSVLASDLSRLAEETIKIEKAGADMVHLDVMDGHFVPNLSFGAPIIKCLRDKSPIHFDVHLMISDPYKYIEDFAKAGADTITFHLESDNDVEKTIKLIKSYDIKVGLTIKPNTKVEEVFPYIEDIDMFLIMSVEPGFGGQSFMENSLDKIKTLREELNKRNLNTDIQVDGGIDDTTVEKCAKAGANVFVAGSYVFKNDYKLAIDTLRENAK